MITNIHWPIVNLLLGGSALAALAVRWVRASRKPAPPLHYRHRYRIVTDSFRGYEVQRWVPPDPEIESAGYWMAMLRPWCSYETVEAARAAVAELDGDSPIPPAGTVVEEIPPPAPASAPCGRCTATSPGACYKCERETGHTGPHTVYDDTGTVEVIQWCDGDRAARLKLAHTTPLAATQRPPDPDTVADAVVCAPLDTPTPEPEPPRPLRTPEDTR